MTNDQINPDITKANTLAVNFYRSQRFFEKSKDLLFTRSWQLAGHHSDRMIKGDLLPFFFIPEFLEEPLILSKDERDEIRCLSNVCTHRANLLLDEPVNSSRIRCSYHGRCFGLNGKFTSMPEFEEAKDFPSEHDNLKRLPLNNIGSILFTSLDPIASFDRFFGEMGKRLHWFPFEKLSFREDLSRDYVLKAHWALYCDNYLEGFHIPYVHPALNKALDYSGYTTELFEYSNLQLGIAKEGDACFDLPDNSPDYEKKIAAYYFWVFPNLMLNFYPWGLSLNQVVPLTLNQTKVRFLTYIMDESKLGDGAGADTHTTELEDEAIVENVQKGIQSRLFSKGRFSPKMEKGVHHFHRLLSEILLS